MGTYIGNTKSVQYMSPYMNYLSTSFLKDTADQMLNTTLFFNKNVVFQAQAEYSYFSADFRLKIFLYYS